MSYNEPSVVDLIVNRFSLPLYVTSTYNGNDLIPTVAASEHSFNIPWNELTSNDASAIDSTTMSVSCIRYRNDPRCLDLVTQWLERSDPQCSFTRDRVGPGLFVTDPFSEDSTSRSALLPENINTFFNNNSLSLKPVKFSNRVITSQKTPVFTICRGNALSSVWMISSGLYSDAEIALSEYHYLRDEPPSRTEFPDLSTLTDITLDSINKKCYYDAVVDEISCTMTGTTINFSTPVNGLLILRISKDITVTKSWLDQVFTYKNSTIHYIYSPLTIDKIVLSDTKPSFSTYAINDSVKWEITIKNMYNETRRTPIVYSKNKLDATTKLSPKIFMNGNQTLEQQFPKVLIADKSYNLTDQSYQIFGNELKLENGSSTVLTGIEPGEYLYITTESAYV